ncbi:hypothetical protein KDD30_09380 [Photobacterium sp. GJ3]|uniref:hypothetical protein n=1 Tax=Photobacterium sp. GJ3 TaxID=2829502 RepID=UPI001B8DA64A|nr:hypothetical protein [Photobacterium sp. GJ3]QUJ66392.1 hypothetical protein KDD30_09380 [Photobacterium sp. GJ3]
MARIRSMKAAMAAAFMMATSAVWAYPESLLQEPVTIDCLVDDQTVALAVVALESASVDLEMLSAAGNRMRNTMQGGSKAQMRMDRRQFPVQVTIETQGETTGLTISEDCKITTDVP